MVKWACQVVQSRAVAWFLVMLPMIPDCAEGSAN